jgi:hypothetical protein
MPSFWPDPFGAPLTWTQPPGFPQPKTAEAQIELIRDYIYMLRENSVLPKPGDELKTPVLGLGDEESPEANAAPLTPAGPAPAAPKAAPGAPRPPVGRPPTGAHGALYTPPHTM